MNMHCLQIPKWMIYETLAGHLKNSSPENKILSFIYHHVAWNMHSEQNLFSFKWYDGDYRNEFFYSIRYFAQGTS